MVNHTAGQGDRWGIAVGKAKKYGVGVVLTAMQSCAYVQLCALYVVLLKSSLYEANFTLATSLVQSFNFDCVFDAIAKD